MTRVSVSGKTWSLSYDAKGNLIGKTNVADASDATTYTWDSRNRLIALDTPGLAARFEYDPLGRRIGKRPTATAFLSLIQRAMIARTWAPQCCVHKGDHGHNGIRVLPNFAKESTLSP